MPVRVVLLHLAPPLAGVVAGYLLGGRLSHLAQLRLRALWLLWLAAVVATLADRLQMGIVPVVTAFVLAATCLVVNLRRSRAVSLAGSVVLAGAALNALTIVLNGAMPYSPAAAQAVGLSADTRTVKNAPAHAETWLRPLGDVIPVHPFSAVVSLGDVLIAIGVAALVATLMRGGDRSAATRETESGEEVMT